MLTLVIGGSASGKSEYAEQLAVESAAPKLYIATMEARDGESQKRVMKHQERRADMGFQTLERPTGLESAELAQYGTVLLECLGTLAANELFSPEGAGEQAEAAILRGISHLLEHVRHVIVVSNDVFGDGIAYDPGTLEYITVLGRLNQAIARQADQVAEVVCGIPILHKQPGTAIHG